MARSSPSRSSPRPLRSMASRRWSPPEQDRSALRPSPAPPGQTASTTRSSFHQPERISGHGLPAAQPSPNLLRCPATLSTASLPTPVRHPTSTPTRRWRLLAQARLPASPSRLTSRSPAANNITPNPEPERPGPKAPAFLVLLPFQGGVRLRKCQSPFPLAALPPASSHG